MALQKKEQTENQKKPENYFSVDQKKERKQSNLSSNISQKKYWQKKFWALFLSKTVI